MLYLYTRHHHSLGWLTVFQGEIAHQLCSIALQYTDTSVCGGIDHLYNSYHLSGMAKITGTEDKDDTNKSPKNSFGS